MITRLKYNDKLYKIIDEYDIKKSSKEVKFNNLKIDFTGCTVADVPYKYQEVQLLQTELLLNEKSENFNEQFIENAEVVYTGYVSYANFPSMKMQQEYRELELELMSPLELATCKTVTATGTFQLEDLIETILEPLLVEDYTIKEINVPDSHITVNYILYTVEFAMKILSNKKNLWWYIYPNKEITVTTIENLLNQNIAKRITHDDDHASNGLKSIIPSVESVDYANVFNLKNVRLFYKSYSGYNTQIDNFQILSIPETQYQGFQITAGEEYNFNYPIVIDETNLKRCTTRDKTETYYALKLVVYKDSISKDKTAYTTATISYNYSTNTYSISSNISFNDDEEQKEFTLIRDSFFNNLITGIKWNGEKGTSILVGEVDTDSALRYVTAKYHNSQEIEKLKGKVCVSGQIEKTIDCNSKWYTEDEIIDYVGSLFISASNETNVIQLVYDKDPELEVGNLIETQLPNFLTEGKFIITDIEYYKQNELNKQWTITARNSNYNENFIDLFRSSEEEESVETNPTIVVGEYITEGIKETHEVENIED